jgi:protease-4
VQLLFADRWTPATTPVARVIKQLKNKNQPGIALVEGFGGIVTGRSRRTPLQGPVMGSDTVSAAIRAAVRNDKVRAIVFRVDSPGGSAVASDTICREVECAREAGKPVIVSMGALAGSGGYYVACSADAIVAEPGTLTGSIGVLGGKFVTTGLTDRVGLSYGSVQRGDHARMYSTHRPFDDGERERMDAWLDRVYVDFTGKVAKGRSMTRDAVHEVARGRVWTGADAIGNGLVDELGGLRRAVELARARGGLPTDAPLRPAVSVPPIARLRPARSSDDPRAAASTSLRTSIWTSGWGSFADLAASLGLPAYGPLTMPSVRWT